jgi:non-ribosomal peptide synthetase component E (peptide arylation enzyme)
MANVLREQGIKKGDRVCIYLPMIPELAVAVFGLCENRCHPLGGIWDFRRLWQVVSTIANAKW